MQVNIYKDKMPGARLFGTSVLYSAKPIPREDVPQGWYCYDLRGTARHPDEPHALVELAEENHAGSILSYLPLKKGGSQFRLVKDMFQMTGTYSTLSEFCAKESIRCPETPIRYLLCPAFPEEAGLFYAQTPERDEELGAIGHVRIDFGYHGREGFYHTWWPRGPEELNTQEFREELDRVVNDLRKGVLKDLPSMRRYCYGSEGVIEGGTCCQNYGFTLETGQYLYRLRCNPIEGDYQAYLSCFDKQTQQMGLTEQGRQRMKGFKDDPVVAEAVVQIQQVLDESPAVGRVTFASGERWNYTDPEKYLQTVREELPCHAATGFHCETLTDDPEVRKAVDDMLCGLYGEENSRTLEDYGNSGMTMGGIS